MPKLNTRNCILKDAHTEIYWFLFFWLAVQYFK